MFQAKVLEVDKAGNRVIVEFSSGTEKQTVQFPLVSAEELKRIVINKIAELEKAELSPLAVGDIDTTVIPVIPPAPVVPPAPTDREILATDLNKLRRLKELHRVMNLT